MAHLKLLDHGEELLAEDLLLLLGSCGGEHGTEHLYSARVGGTRRGS